MLTLPLDMLSTDNVASDIFHGCFVVTCTLFSFIGLVWLREQILHGGGPDWLERDDPPPANIPPPPPLPPAPPQEPQDNDIDRANPFIEQNEVKLIVLNKFNKKYVLNLCGTICLKNL